MSDEAGKLYEVRVSATVRAALREQVRYIAVEQQAPLNAARWLERVWTCIDGLEFMPLRHGVAEGYGHMAYVVRRVILGNHLILFTADEVGGVVFVLGIRHGAMQPEGVDLPLRPTE